MRAWYISYYNYNEVIDAAAVVITDDVAIDVAIGRVRHHCTSWCVAAGRVRVAAVAAPCTTSAHHWLSAFVARVVASLGSWPAPDPGTSQPAMHRRSGHGSSRL